MKLLVMMDATRVTGPAKQLLAVVPALVGAGVDCEMLVCIREGVKTTPFWEAILGLGLPTHRIEDRFAGDPRLIGQFSDVVRKVRPDILQTHGYRPNALARLTKNRLGIPWLGFWHGATWENWKVRLYNRVDMWALAKADRAVTVSKKQAETLAEHLPSRSHIEVIPNAVVIEPVSLTPESRAVLRAPYVNDFDTRLVGVFGRFSSEKGQDVFLRSLATLHDQNVAALLLGEGPDEAALRHLANELAIADRVHFLGYQADIAKYYALIDLLVLPSRSEGLPNVVLEAMTCGVPVIATSVGGVPEVVDHERNGILVPTDQPDELAAAMKRLLCDWGLTAELAAAGKRFVAEAYSLHARVQALKDLYASVLERK